jgi:O-antigen/teichoic acid export membrane protein
MMESGFNLLKKRLQRSTLVRNTISLLAGSGTRLLLQAVYFFLIARALGVEQYGAFIGVFSLISILVPFAPLGRGQILIRNVARDPATFRDSWGNALCVTVLSGSVLVGLVLLVARAVLAHRISLLLVLLVAVSDLLFAAIVGLAAQAFQAVEQLHRTAQVYVVLTGLRAVSALILFLAIRHPQALSWGFFYCLSSCIATIYTVVLVCSRLGYPKFKLHRLHSDFWAGIHFSISLASQSIYNDIDKTMLVRLSTFDAAGIYAVAYRLADLSFQPVGALLWSAYPRFFRHGQQGLASTTAFAKRLMPFAFVYSIVVSTGLFFAAPLLPIVFGRDYNLSVEALRWLSPIILLRVIHYFLSYALTGADFQGLRSTIQVFVAGLNILLNLWLIPAFSWRGAAWASIASDGALAAGMCAAIATLQRRGSSMVAVNTPAPKVIL